MRQRYVSLCLMLILLASTVPLTARASSPPACSCQELERQLKLTNPPMSGPDVEDLQKLLMELGFFSGPITGTFGRLTEDAVKNFQEWARLDPLGEVGPRTREALNLAAAEISLALAAPLTPPPGEMRLIIDTEKRTLTVLVDDKPFKVFPCAVGKISTKSPVGEWAVVYKGTNCGGGFGTRWLGLNVPWGIYGIHGTNKPGSIGTAASAGCIRMHNRDVEQLYPWVKVGTRVSIVGPYPRIKVSSPVGKGKTSKEVQQVQLSLREAGFNPGFTDGRFGNDTEKAVKALQTHFGLEQTGVADLNVLTILRLR